VADGIWECVEIIEALDERLDRGECPPKPTAFTHCYPHLSTIIIDNSYCSDTILVGIPASLLRAVFESNKGAKGHILQTGSPPMKKPWRHVLLSLFLLTCAALQGAEVPQPGTEFSKQSRISFAYGVGSVYLFMYDYANIFSHILFFDTDSASYTYIGPLSFTYDRLITKHVSLGVVIAYAHHRIEYIDGLLEGDREEVDLFAGAPRVLFRWGGKVLRVYHGISLGLALWLVGYEDADSQDSSEVLLSPAVHLYLLGLDLRLGDAASIFLDVGGGYLGSLNFGLAVYL
jgi:hypothetical protein